MRDHRPVVAAMADWFLPGFKAGGPVRTLANLTDRLADQLSFVVLTRDRDLGDNAPYPELGPHFSRDVGAARVHYLTPSASLPLATIRQLSAVDYDILYCNSLFSPAFSLAPVWARHFRLLRRTPLVLAPRGELGRAALSDKRFRKRAMLRLGKLLGVYRDVFWHATDEAEAADIRHWFGPDARIVVVPNIGGVPTTHAEDVRPKHRGELRLVFVGRISRMKNVIGALQILRQYRGPITYDIFGPIEDLVYFERCRALAEGLPPTTRVVFRGPIEHERISSVMPHYDLLFLPTLGENFGHVIIEAMSAGLPVLISDRTPWRNLAAHQAGWDLPLEDESAFAAVLSECAAMDESEFTKYRAGAQRLGVAHMRDEEVARRSAELFERALRESESPPLHNQSLRAGA